MKIIIKEDEWGFLFKNGKYQRVLEPGKHILLGGGYSVERVEVDSWALMVPGCNLDTLLEDAALSKKLTVAEVADDTIALHYINGRFHQPLTSGRYAFWNLHQIHEFRTVDISESVADSGLPAALFAKLPGNLYKRVEVLSYQKGRLCINGKFIRLLDAGTYFFWQNGEKVEVSLVDARLLQVNIQGQEMLTLDKVAVRINFVCRYRIEDFVKVMTEVEDYEEQIRVLAQLALREYIGRSRLDELLENKEQLADFMLARLKAHQAECFVTFFDTGVKDMILPGEVRDIMNTVLIAEKRAQANVITRREEVASTRSLLNTAKLMEENPTLLHLKEMECLEKICENVGNITVSGTSDLLGQLAGIMRGGSA